MAVRRLRRCVRAQRHLCASLGHQMWTLAARCPKVAGAHGERRALNRSAGCRRGQRFAGVTQRERR
eukprot:6856861-Alexandrium_andersonii.AAC.2